MFSRSSARPHSVTQVKSCQIQDASELRIIILLGGSSAVGEETHQEPVVSC